MSKKEEFLKFYKAEYPITIRVLKAYPEGKGDCRPNPKSKTAKELALLFPNEAQTLIDVIAKGEMTWNPEFYKQEFGSWEKLMEVVEDGFKKLETALEAASEEDYEKLMKGFTGNEVPRVEILWGFLCDQIHHRGQFSIYLRLVDAKVPSIYGPTADEPWNG
jgi:uncharacterized damage-inducible protein DinB